MSSLSPDVRQTRIQEQNEQRDLLSKIVEATAGALSRTIEGIANDVASGGDKIPRLRSIIQNYLRQPSAVMTLLCDEYMNGEDLLTLAKYPKLISDNQKTIAANVLNQLRISGDELYKIAFPYQGYDSVD